MANLKSLKNRIKSVQSTKKITQAMKLVSASKLKKARDAMEDNRPYIQNMDHLVASLVREVPFREQIPILCGRDNPQNYLIIAIGSERGLCGGFNSNLAKSIKKKIIELKSQGKNVRVEVIGNKIYTLLQSFTINSAPGSHSNSGNSSDSCSSIYKGSTCLIEALRAITLTN